MLEINTYIINLTLKLSSKSVPDYPSHIKLSYNSQNTKAIQIVPSINQSPI